MYLCVCMHGLSLQDHRGRKVLYAVAKLRYGLKVCASLLLASSSNKSGVLVFANRVLMRRTRFIKTSEILSMLSRKIDEQLRHAIHRNVSRQYTTVAI